MSILDYLTILSEPVSDGAIFDGGDWLTEMPLTNMQVPARYEIAARSATTDPDDTQFDIDLGAVENIRAFVLLGNFTTAATMTLTKFSDGTFTTPLETFTTLPLFPAAPFGTIPFGAPWWYSGLLPWPNPERRAHFQIVFPEDVGGQFWRVEINDEANPAGYIDIGRLFMAGDGVWIPQFNYEPENNQFGIRDNTLKANTLAGGTRVWRRVNPRYFSFSVKNQDEANVFGPSWRLIDWAGFDREVFVIPQPSDTDHLQQRSFFARISQASPLVQAMCKRGHVALELTEII